MIKKIKQYQEINLKNPTLIAAWPGMGNVALGAINYLRMKLKATLFAEIDLSQFILPELVRIEEGGIAKLPELPKSLFYYTNTPELIIFESETQLTGKAGKQMVDLILDLAENYKTKKIYTGAAFPYPMSHNEPSAVYAAVNDISLISLLEEKGIGIMQEGQISGLNGLLIGFAKTRNIVAACLLATMPLYAINFSNPKASKVLVEAFGKLVDVKVDIEEMNANIRNMDNKMEIIEEKIKEIFPLAEKENKTEKAETEIAENETPHYVLEKIEKLFKEAKIDKKKAYLLKEELDRWNLYKLYEDRFLDLFREHQ